MSNKDPFVTTFHQWLEIFMHRSMRHFIKFARESGLSMSMIGTLFHLNRWGSSGVTDLGDHLGVTSAASSQMLERLVQQELILRTEDPTDRRVKQIVLTKKGCQVLEESTRARQGWLEGLSDCLSDEEKKQITAALNIMINKADQLEDNIQK
ncbi:MAG: MarR family transcriptional regulator [Anaerolineales bacterium]|nr:MarR family transcriptional regulator [Anaerolineales bacterium]